MGKKKYLPLLLVICMVLMGCQQASTPTTASLSVSTTVPTQPQSVTGAYFTGLSINFSDFFVTDVSVTYDENSLTMTYTVDAQTIRNTYDYQGRLQFQRIDGEDGFWSEETFTYTYHSDEPLSESYNREGYSREIQRTFDKFGNVLTCEYYDSTRSWNSYTYTYDDQGRQLSEKYVSSGGSDTLLEYTYADHGGIASERKYSGGKLSRQVLRTFNANGHLIAEDLTTWNAETGNPFFHNNTFTLDENGRILIEHQSTSNGDWYHSEYTYDAAGNILSQNYSDSYGQVSESTHTYTAAGLISSSTEHCDGQEYTWTYKYNSAGQQTLSACINPEGLEETTRRTYDAAGNLLEQVITAYDGSTQKEVRTYDDHGNLLTYTAYSDGETVSSLCTYTYGYTELSPSHAQQLKNLMSTLFVEFMP